MRIGVLTGGGDVPGLNSCIKALVSKAVDDGHEVVGFRRGWWGVMNYNLEDPASQAECTIPLSRQSTRSIDYIGGTILQSSRTNPAHVPPKEAPLFLRGEGFDEKKPNLLDFTPHVLRVLEHLGIDVLVPIGGDDTLGYGHRLYQSGVPVVAIPKTMDNDVNGTEYCLGFSTAISRSVHFIHQLRSSAGANERLAVIELFGRSSGETCLMTAYLSGVDRAVIPEVQFDPEKLGALMVEDRRNNPNLYAIATISEGARFTTEWNGKPSQIPSGPPKLGGIGLLTAEALKEITGIGTIYQQVGYLMRSGAPDSLDLMAAVNFATLAAHQVTTRQFGTMAALSGGRYTVVSLDGVADPPRRVDVDQLYDPVEYRPQLRSVLDMPMYLY